jgi:hypothetical protein
VRSHLLPTRWQHTRMARTVSSCTQERPQRPGLSAADAVIVWARAALPACSEKWEDLKFEKVLGSRWCSAVCGVHSVWKRDSGVERCFWFHS